MLGQVVVDALSEPHDVDRDGVTLPAEEVGETTLAVPAQPRRPPVVSGRRRSRRRH